MQYKVRSRLIHRGEQLILFVQVQKDIGVFLETGPPGIGLHDGLVDHCGLKDVDLHSELILSGRDAAA